MFSLNQDSSFGFHVCQNTPWYDGCLVSRKTNNDDSDIDNLTESDKDSKIESLEETLDIVLDDIKSEPSEELKEIVDELSLLKRDTNRRGVDMDGDGTIDGYDNNGDGLIDEPIPSSSRRAQYVMNERPFYARPNFNWGDRSKWINNQNAVNYWLTYIKNEKDTNYPDNFDSKTY